MGGCGCGQPSAGFKIVWQHRDGGNVTEHDDQSGAYAARTKAGGRGLVLKVTKRVK